MRTTGSPIIKLPIEKFLDKNPNGTYNEFKKANAKSKVTRSMFHHYKKNNMQVVHREAEPNKKNNMQVVKEAEPKNDLLLVIHKGRAWVKQNAPKELTKTVLDLVRWINTELGSSMTVIEKE